MRKTNPLIAVLACDGYKLGHYEQDAPGIENKYFTWTPRGNKYLPQVDKVVSFNIQGAIQQDLIDFFNDNFFLLDKEFVVNEYKRVIKSYLFLNDVNTSHIEELHDLGYLPLRIKAIKEGNTVPLRCPMVTFENTDKRFYWVAGYIEDIISTSFWQPMTVASIARKYKQLFEKYAMLTVGNTDFCCFQGHDFSYRGLMTGIDAVQASGAAWLTSFFGTDNIPAIIYLENLYGADSSKEIIGCSVPASEHSVACGYGPEGEDEYLRRLIQDVYPTGIVSVVSDTWDLFDLITDKLPKLKDVIMGRDGKVVIRPDSGNPADILCGNPNGETEAERLGVVELLWNIFGGTTTDQGYRVLDSHIGTIYGDSITLDLAEEICVRLMAKGFASINWVAGVGSYSLLGQLSRDSLGFALKETNIIKNGEEIAVFKDPKTDDGTKKSQRGRVVVVKDPETGMIVWKDGLTAEQEAGYTDNLLQLVYEDGEMFNLTTLGEIRERLKN